MARALAWATVWLWAAGAFGAENAVKNASFEEDADRNGVPDAWATSGSPQQVEQRLSLDRGRDGRRCARLDCARFEGGSPATHAMLCQMGVPVKAGVTYRLSFWARADGIAADAVSVAISDTSSWSNCGLRDSFVPTAEWARYELVFRGTRTCAEKTRLQIWFLSTGTLWMDDVELIELGRELYRPGQAVPAAGGVNLVPNASFECGTDGWGSSEGDRVTHWGGPMNRLFGELDTATAFHGRASLKIALTPENQPVSYFDYYELHRQPIRVPLAANLGYLEVEPGRTYTFSAYLKADRPETPARLRVQPFQAAYLDKPVRVSADWQRFQLTFKAASRWCYVLVGPDLSPSRESPDPPDRATVWVDAVQLEQGKTPGGFRPRTPIEFGVWSAKPGNVFGWDEPVRFTVKVHREEGAAAPAAMRLFLSESQDRSSAPGAAGEVTWDVPASGDSERPVVFEPRPQLRGFFRLHAELKVGGRTQARDVRLAVIPTYRSEDSRFGVNHAYPWPHLLDLCRQAGLIWVRDWSLKWQEVEPDTGRFTFAETDPQIDRPRRHGLQVLGLLPFPSSNWSSSAPASVSGKGAYPQNRARIAYAPRDEAEFESYVATTVKHYAGRIRWWQVFNEPLFTDYSLPRKHGYDGATYGRLTKAFARVAKKADPNCRVLAGIGYLGEGQILEDFEKFFAAGALEVIDAVDIHHYPRLRPPEFLEPLLEKLNALMEKHGGRKPIWLTEYGYYADDDPGTVPAVHHGFDQPLPSERVAAEYAVRWAVIGLANGIDKVFYHAGTCQGINSDHLQGVFYKYEGQAREIYAAQAVLAHWLSPHCRFVNKLPLGDGVKGYLFRDGDRLVAVVWAGKTAPAPRAPAKGAGGQGVKPAAQVRPRTIRLAHEQLQLWDLMGRPQQAREFTPSGRPVYIIGGGLSDDAMVAGLKAK